MLISETTRPIEVPNEAGQQIIIRKLTRKKLRKAADARQLVAITKLRELGGAEFLKEVRSISVEQEDANADDVLRQFDEDKLLELGVVGWTYDEPYSVEALDRLDPATAEYVARQIVAYSRGELEDATERGNA